MKARVLLIPDLDFTGTFPTAQASTTKGKWVKLNATTYEIIDDFSYFNVFSVQAISDPSDQMDQSATVNFKASNFTPFSNPDNSYSGTDREVDRTQAYDYFADYVNTLGDNVTLTVSAVPSATMYGQGEVFPFKMIKVQVTSTATTGKLQFEFAQK